MTPLNKYDICLNESDMNIIMNMMLVSMNMIFILPTGMTQLNACLQYLWYGSIICVVLLIHKWVMSHVWISTINAPVNSHKDDTTTLWRRQFQRVVTTETNLTSQTHKTWDKLGISSFSNLRLLRLSQICDMTNWIGDEFESETTARPNQWCMFPYR